MTATGDYPTVYGIWNNKGGVGKTTLAFHLACHYAKSNPEKVVCVLDMCPQANISMALLRNHEHDDNPIRPFRKLQLSYKFENNSGEEERRFYERTICGYLRMVIEHPSNHQLTPMDFVLWAKEYNPDMPKNLCLLCGDPNLEILGRAVEEHRRRMATGLDINYWKDGTMFMRNFIKKLSTCARQKGGEMVGFVDTNPAFSVYTELAITASTKLLIPLNSDDFSREAVIAMLHLIYGNVADLDEDYNEGQYGSIEEQMFWYRARELGVPKPKIHLAIQNRVTVYGDRTRASTAHSVMKNRNAQVLQKYYEHHPENFTHQIRDLDDFSRTFTTELKDFHKTAVHCIYLGCSLESLKTDKGSYISFDGCKDRIDKKLIDTCISSLSNVVQML